MKISLHNIREVSYAKTVTNVKNVENLINIEVKCEKAINSKKKNCDIKGFNDVKTIKCRSWAIF